MSVEQERLPKFTYSVEDLARQYGNGPNGMMMALTDEEIEVNTLFEEFSESPYTNREENVGKILEVVQEENFVFASRAVSWMLLFSNHPVINQLKGPLKRELLDRAVDFDLSIWSPLARLVKISPGTVAGINPVERIRDHLVKFKAALWERVSPAGPVERK